MSVVPPNERMPRIPTASTSVIPSCPRSSLRHPFLPVPIGTAPCTLGAKRQHGHPPTEGRGTGKCHRCSLDRGRPTARGARFAGPETTSDDLGRVLILEPDAEVRALVG